MSVEFVLGRAGSGKTNYCYEQIEKALAVGSYDDLIVLTPEQFNLQTEKALCKKFYPGLLTVDVRSFTRLAHKISVETGYPEINIIDDLERIMIIKKLLQDHKRELKFFKKSVTTDGFLESINQFITVCEQNSITMASLEQMIKAEMTTTLLRYKLEDIKNIYEWFQQYIHDQFVTSEQTMEILAKAIEKSTTIEQSIIWIDGFYQFSQNQIQVIIALIKKAKHVVITLPIDKAYSTSDKINIRNPFYEVIKTYQKLWKLCEENGIKIKTSKFQPIAQIESALTYLEENYLKDYPKAYLGSNEQVLLMGCGNKEKEIDNVLKKIAELIRNEGYCYKDIAILVGDLGGYKSSLENGLKEYDMPYFLDMKRNLHTNSLVAMLLTVLEVMTSNWSYRSVMALLRTYMLPVERDDIDLLENVLLEFGIKGRKRWEDAWELRTKDEAFNSNINRIRQMVLEPILSLETKIKESKDQNGHLKVKNLTTELYNFMAKIQVEETIAKRVDQYQLEGERALEVENAQIWGQILEVLERLVGILGEEEVTLGEYKNILRSSFGYMKMGIIPPTQDQIIVGTVDRTMLPTVKALFVLGMNEGLIPKLEETMPIFSDMDKAVLGEINDGKDEGANRLKELAKSEILNSGMFSVYTALTKAKNQLFVSCVMADENGKVMRPSSSYYRLKKMFNEQDYKNVTALEAIQAPIQTFGYIGKLIREDLEGHNTPLEWRDAVSWYFEHETWQKEIKQLTKQLMYTNQQHYLLPDTTNLLYERILETSISKLETFQNCPCCYFIQYGIKAEERKMLTWNTKELGTLFHSVLEKFPKVVEKQGTTWKEIKPEALNECVKLAVDEVIQIDKNTDRIEGKFKYTAHKLFAMSKRAIRALTYQIQNGEFEPQEYEVSFGMGALPAIEIALEEGALIRLNGQIDRVDVYMKDGEETYIKIIDYKSGKKNFELLEVYYGLQLQLLLYLDAYLKYNKKYVPAGVFYFHIDTPYIQYKVGMSDTEIESNHMKNFKLSGLVLDDPEVIRLMDRDGRGDIIPAGLKKDGTLTKVSSAATPEQFEAIRGHITETIKQLGQEILKGKVSANPYKLGDKDPCGYCKYHAICQFDESKADNCYHQLEKLDKETIWECICNREEEL